LDDPYPDMELVVSDNANTDETQEVLKSFSGDRRLKVVRLEEAGGVVDNWNNALKASSGEYFLMMGDDDCLLPGYFKRMEDLLKKYEGPDCVIYNAFTYVAPQAVNGNRVSYYNKSHFAFGPDFQGEGFLPEDMRASIVRDMYRFRVRIPLNMQTTLVSRRGAMAYIKGDVFHAPFPDHYALNALLLSAPRWVYVPENLLIVGISPKSFGHFVYSNCQEQGLAYLGIDSDFKGKLPGNELLNYMHVWLGSLKEDHQIKLQSVHISRPDYVRRQVYYWYMQYRSKIISLHDLMTRIRLLNFGDWVGLCWILFDRECWKRAFRMMTFSKKTGVQRTIHGLEALENVASIDEFRNQISQINNGEIK